MPLFAMVTMLFGRPATAQNTITVSGTCYGMPSYPAEFNYYAFSDSELVDLSSFWEDYGTLMTDASGHFSFTIDPAIGPGEIGITTLCSFSSGTYADGDIELTLNATCECWAYYTLEQGTVEVDGEMVPDAHTLFLTPHVGPNEPSEPYWQLDFDENLYSYDMQPIITIDDTLTHWLHFSVTDVNGCYAEYLDSLAVDGEGFLRSGETTVVVLPWVIDVVTTSTAEAPLSSGTLSVYPNPGSGVRSFFSTDLVTGTYRARVFDVHGKAIADLGMVKATSGAAVELPFADLPSGMYVFELSGMGKAIRARVMQQ